MTEQLLIYFAIVNSLTLLVSLLDKLCAVNQLPRVPEWFLLFLSWIGGAVAAKFVQIISGHKSLKLDFTVNLNLIIIFQLALTMGVWTYQNTNSLRDDNLSVLQTWLGGKDDSKPDRPRRFGPGSD
ncbi:DUF1294 domain-containing protein [Rhodobacteraceae bacterium]|nr:DUF1294 domain-containing protein [Paracoccaceae bacterium]